jgi:glyoxylate reductase
MAMAENKLRVIVTRKLPEPVETRLRELFEVELNLDDTPMSEAALADAIGRADVLVPTLSDEIDHKMLAKAGPNLKLIANYGAGFDHIRDRAAARHPGDQHARRADRRHRRHGDGADSRRAAAA